MKEFHIIYRTTNTLDGKYYLGKHSTNILEDGYLGSGLLINRAIKKHGTGSFQREILFVYDNATDMELKEQELVTEQVLSDPNCFNLALGGQGGNLGAAVNARIGTAMSVLLTGKPKTEAHKNALRQVWVEKEYSVPLERKQRIKETITNTWAAMGPDERQAKCGHQGAANGFYGKKHTTSSIETMKANLPDRSGSNNSRAKSVTLFGVTYATCKECMETLCISKTKFYKLLGETQ